MIILTSLILWSAVSIAEGDSFTQCQFNLLQKNIDFGRIDRSSILYQSTGIGKLPSKKSIIRVNCTNEVEPELMLRGGEISSQIFQFGLKSRIDILLEKLVVDGKKTSFKVNRNGIVNLDPKIKPGDIIQSHSQIKGKNIEFIFSVTPYIVNGESLQPDRPLQSNILLIFNKKTSDSLTVNSTFNPSACNPALTAGGVVDYKNINVSQLNKSGPTVLPAKVLMLSIQCDSPSNVAIRVDSNRPNSLINIRNGTMSVNNTAKPSQDTIMAGLGKGLPFGLNNITEPDIAGLGISGGQKIGGYLMLMPSSEVSIDGVKGATRYLTHDKPSTSSNWIKTIGNDKTGGSVFSGLNYIAFSNNINSGSPIAFKNLTATLVIQAFITDVVNLNLSKPIQLDGSSKVEIYYF